MRDSTVAFVGTEDKRAHYMKDGRTTFCGIRTSPGNVSRVNEGDWKVDCDKCRTERAKATLKKIKI